MQQKTRLAIGVLAAGVVAAGGTAMTTSNTVSSTNVAGYSKVAVTGATVTDIEHGLSADGTTVLTTALAFSTDLTADDEVRAGFDSSALEDCVLDAPANTALCTYATNYSTQSVGDFVVTVS